ncbi:hypothetical protein PR202_gb01014 [Eleusine coracana subsp. coracana]|uniref:MSP domain-containing protein n=1 Tax=Eleusine coracana subsp. coracana TaxID=191504 RepID=A0AAV5DT24_ELECO|nr:hypothetical protein PR202_gb01014 [Eleusine coracana subsp. coracana]
MSRQCRGCDLSLSSRARLEMEVPAAAGGEDRLVVIHPDEICFLFEVKKQISCSIHLANRSDHYVAFKVKTTSPKIYCVRPNVGVILPRSSRDFTVTMQEQKTAPPNLQIKDKFLVQTTVVPVGTTDEDIFPAYVAEDVQDLQSKLNNLEAKLEEAETLIVKLREETRTTIEERDKLRKEMVFLRGASTARIQSGFPMLFVLYMAFVGMSLGFLLHLF